MTLTLISDFLLVRAVPDVADSRGILSPYGRHADTPVQATVMQAGPGYITPHGYHHSMPCVVGDIVMLQFNAGTPVRLDGEELRIVSARDIFGVVP